MAEGWAHALANSSFDIQSAGIEAHGKNPRAIAVMREAGQDIAEQESTKLTDEMLGKADFVVTVCGNADENCPVVQGAVLRVPLHYVDPKVADGTPIEGARYDERCAEIARDMFFIMSEASNQLNSESDSE